MNRSPSSSSHRQPRRNPRLSHLRCISCALVLPLEDSPRGCPACEVAARPSSLEAVYGDLPPSVRPSASGFQWGEWLPYLEGVSLGEGSTPGLELPRLASELGIAKLSVKHEGMNPTGSHKDRMSAQAVSRALEVGASSVVLASSGNAAVSAAAYCAAAGLRCEVATYRDMPQAFVAALRRLGAQRFAFDRGAERWEHVRRRVEDDGAFALTNYCLPPVGSPVFGVEGYRAVALECAAEGCIPDHVLVPTARGDLLWGLYSGFRDLRLAGLIDRMPRLWAVEPIPRLSRVLQGERAQGEFPGKTAQFSIAGGTVTLQQVHAVRRSEGGAVVVDDAGAHRGTSSLAREGFWVELCAGSSVTAVTQLLADNRIAISEHVLLVLTAKGDRDPFDPAVIS
ncbi:MAG: pyridoxal-phosphate dependent enzyme [Ramlibacter sp.]|nr:pyridoxal-phosphate dependent enzyme [Ramlibacter sp.]